MTLAQQGSRTIHVAGEEYRWALSPDSGYNVIVAQTSHGSGAKLLVSVNYIQTIYLSAEANGIVPITPALVSSVIDQATKLGWQPEKTGRDFVCDLNADETITLRSKL